MSIINTTQKKRGRPRVDSEELKVRFERTELDAIDSVVEQEKLKGRPEAVRRLIRQALGSEAR